MMNKLDATVIQKKIKCLISKDKYESKFFIFIVTLLVGILDSCIAAIETVQTVSPLFFNQYLVLV